MSVEEEKSVCIGAFCWTGCLIKLNNRQLAEADEIIKFSDDYIKHQGLEAKFHLNKGMLERGLKLLDLR